LYVYPQLVRVSSARTCITLIKTCTTTANDQILSITLFSYLNYILNFIYFTTITMFAFGFSGLKYRCFLSYLVVLNTGVSSCIKGCEVHIYFVAKMY